MRLISFFVFKRVEGVESGFEVDRSFFVVSDCMYFVFVWRVVVVRILYLGNKIY